MSIEEGNVKKYRASRKQMLREGSKHKKRWICLSCGWIGILETKPCPGCRKTPAEKSFGEMIFNFSVDGFFGQE